MGSVRNSMQSLGEAALEKRSNISLGRKSTRQSIRNTRTVETTVPVLGYYFTEAARSKLGVTLTVINFFTILTSLVLICGGLYLRYHIGEYTNLVANFNDGLIIYSIMGLGGFTLIVNMMGGFFCLLVINPIRREKYQIALTVYMVLSSVAVIFALVVSGFCFKAITQLENSFSGGITRAMQEYNENDVLKAELHDLQTTFECCGNKGYTDWFKIPWVISEYDVNFHSKVNATRNGYFHDDVPFSCCNKLSDRPCINMDTHTNSKHKNYDYRKDLNIYTDGCVDSLMDFFGDLMLMNGGSFVIAVFGLQFILTFMVRYYQTSITSALESGKPSADGYGYMRMKTVTEEVPVEDNQYSESKVLINSDPVYDTVDDFGGYPDDRNITPLGDQYQEPMYENVPYRGDQTYQSMRGNIPPPPPLPTHR